MKILLFFLAAAAGPDITRLEELLTHFTLEAKLQLAENASCLDSDHRQWQRGVLDACKDDACRRAAYLERLATLLPLQRDTTAPRDLDLPAAPGLLWAIAPTSGAKGETPASKPLQVEGRLGYGCPECGYFLRSDSGRATLLIGDDALRGANAEQLALLREQSRDARLMARGFAAGQGFDARHCVFLYLVP